MVCFYDVGHDTFNFDPQTGFPKLRVNPSKPYAESILKQVDDKLDKRPFRVGYGGGNDNVREYVLAISQYSYLTSYAWLPYGMTSADLDREKLEVPGALPFREMSVAALADAMDAVARVWLHDLRRFCWWKKNALQFDRP